MNRGQLAGVTADLGLRDVAARLGTGLPELALETVQGRLAATWDAQGYAISADQLVFRTREGQSWPGGQLRLQHDNGLSSRTVSTSVDADRVDLAALAALATRVPLPEASRTLLASLRPTGRVEGLSARWQGPVPPPPAAGQTAAPAAAVTAYQAKGRFVGLALAGQPSGRTSTYGPYPIPGRPGLTGATGDFNLDQDGGRARLAIANGSIELPGMFELPVIPLTSLQADARWTLDGERIEAWLENVRMANADAAGTARAHWQTSDPARSSAKSRFPGVLDLDASLSRAVAAQTHRYLPLSLSPAVRRYVREAVRGGVADKVDFRVRGDLWDLPFHQPGADGEFRVTSSFRGVDYAYLPTYLQTAGEPAWPVLQGVDGQLVLDRASLQLKGLSAAVDGLAKVKLSEGEVAVPDLMVAPRLSVSARAQGPASEVLDFVQRSPVNALIGGALARTTGTGTAGVAFKLQMPLEKTEDLSLQGNVHLGGNDLRITPDTPLLERSVGNIAFTERGFKLSDAKCAALRRRDRARRRHGARRTRAGPSKVEFRGHGTASAEGVRARRAGLCLAPVRPGQRQRRLHRRGSAFRGWGARAADQHQPAGHGDQPALRRWAKKAEESLPLRYDNAVLGVGEPTPSGEVARSDRLAVEMGPAPAAVG